MHIQPVISFKDNGLWQINIEAIVKEPGTDITDLLYCPGDEFNTYEQALEQGLKEALLLIK
jgi:hypothetical protein